MHLLFADQWLSPSLIQALGWTLLHSLWQGLIIAIVALFILWLTKKSSPLLRYNLLLFLLTLFIITVTATFSGQFRNAEMRKADKAISPASFSSQPFSENKSFTVVEQTKNYFLDFENFFNTHATLIVAIWLLVFCVQCLRLCSSLGYINRIRHFKTYIPASNWQERCEQLKNLLGIKKPVSLLESGIVKVPLVVGFFKPLILLPVGVLANLPYNQVESILLHELAHIRRRDYIVNLLQSLVETVFFFNPSLLWLSLLIKEEREACCDEIAVKYLDSKSDYIRALVSFQEYAINSSGYAMAFPGNRNSLLQRVKRIINNENKKLSSMEKAILFCGIIAITAVGVLSTREAKAQNEIRNPISKSLDKKTDTIPKQNAPSMSRNEINANKNGYLRSRVSINDDGKAKTVEVEATDLKGRVIKAKMVDDVINKLSINGTEVNAADFGQYKKEIDYIIKFEQAQTLSAVQQTKQEKNIKSEEKNIKAQEKYIEAQEKNIKAQRAQKEIETTQAIQVQQQINVTAQITLKNSDDKDSHQQVEEILEVLKKNNIIKGKEGTTFKLTDGELLVNEVKQSEALHRVLKQKYIYKPGDFFTFSSSGGTTSITVINRED